MTVVIEPLALDVEQTGLYPQQLQTDVEWRLRQAGIPVLTPEEGLRVPGTPSLSVKMGGGRGSPAQASFALHVALKQRACPETALSQATVSLWSVGVGSIERAKLHTVGARVRDLVDQFICAYLSVNPRPVGNVVPSSASPRRDLIR